MNFDICQAMNELNDLFAKYLIVHDIRSELTQMNVSLENIKSLDDKIRQIQIDGFELQKKIIEAFTHTHLESYQVPPVPQHNLN